MEVYLGKQPQESPYEVTNKSSNVILSLVRIIENSGRNIKADNWYTSIPLVIQLLNKKLTVKKNKVEILLETISKKRKA